MYIIVSIVQDNPTFRSLLESILGNSSGCQCGGEYGSAEEGLKVSPELQPDMVLMDIRLQQMSGIQYVVEIKTICGTFKSS